MQLGHEITRNNMIYLSILTLFLCDWSQCRFFITRYIWRNGEIISPVSFEPLPRDTRKEYTRDNELPNFYRLSVNTLSRPRVEIRRRERWQKPKYLISYVKKCLVGYHLSDIADVIIIYLVLFLANFRRLYSERSLYLSSNGYQAKESKFLNSVRNFSLFSFHAWSIVTYPAAIINHIDVYVPESKFSHLNCNFVKDNLVGISGCPQKGRWALRGCVPRGRHFCENVHLACTMV